MIGDQIMKKQVALAMAALMLAVVSSVSYAEDNLPYVELADCPIEVPADADLECGLLVVPENYAKPEGQKLRLPYIILHSPNRNPDSSPLLFTEGGPGGTSLQSVWGFKDSVMLQDRDIIIFEQRGNLFAEPSLACTIDELYDKQTESSPCKDKFIAAGIDLTQYHTARLAEDIESLRLALGIEQWNLFGTSYSTRLSQVLMDRHPEGIRSVILQSVSPLQETRFQHDPEHSYRALHVMFEDCAADLDCAAAFPDLEARFFALVAQLNQSPIELTLENPNDGSPYPYEVSGRTLIDWMVGRAFYGPAHPPFITAAYPLLIHQLSTGNFSFLDAWAQNELNNDIFTPDFIAFGLYLTVNCQDDAGSVGQVQLTEQTAEFPQMDGYLRFLDEWNLCQLWDLPAAPPLSDGPVSSDLPTLVLAGRYDPVTPPAWSAKVAENLPNAFYVEFPSKGHSLDQGSGCAQEIKRSFLQDPWRQPDTTCLADEPQPTFILADRVLSTKGFKQSWADINFGVPQGNTGYEILSAGSLLVGLAEIVVFVVLAIKVLAARSERRKKIQDLAFVPHSLAGLTSIFSWASVLLMSKASNTIGQNEALMDFNLFEVTPTVIALGMIVLAQMLCAAVLIVLVLRAWFNRQGSLLNRTALTLVALAGVIFWFFYFRWDFVTIVFNALGY